MIMATVKSDHSHFKCCLIHYKSGNWRSDYNHFKSYLSHYISDLSHWRSDQITLATNELILDTE